MTALRSCAKVLTCGTLVSIIGLCAPSTIAQTAEAPRKHATIHALFVSDIHFEPFWDPAKLPRLAAAPVTEWNAILAGPASPDREAQFAALEEKCHTRGEDTAYPLFESSLHAMQSAARNAEFVMVGGDLISHAFSCKYEAAFPNAEPGAYQDFVLKTIEFVLGQLRRTLPAARVYAALGNNDSDCGDYRLDEFGSFLSRLSGAIAAGLPPAARSGAASTFADAGYYAADLPAPLPHSRMLVLDDTFLSRRYGPCSGKSDANGAQAQLAWLRVQLENARRDHESVWVMAHIPPGIDPYSTAAKLRNVCAGSAPEMFLSTPDLPKLLAQYGDVIHLALFAHTHMDEMRLFKPESDQTTPRSGGVAAKFIPSISPINGNAPSFIVATIDPKNTIVSDYRVIAARHSSGDAYEWKEEYDYAATYHQKAFDASALNNLFAGFSADAAGTAESSSAYLRSYYVRDQSAQLRLFWPQYVCALSAYTADSYKDCRCPAPAP